MNLGPPPPFPLFFFLTHTVYSERPLREGGGGALGVWEEIALNNINLLFSKGQKGDNAVNILYIADVLQTLTKVLLEAKCQFVFNDFFSPSMESNANDKYP